MKAQEHLKELVCVLGWTIENEFDYHMNIFNDNKIFMSIYWTKKGTFTIGRRINSKFIWSRNVSLTAVETCLNNPDKIKKIRHEWK
jgi:hypothetical protein